MSRSGLGGLPLVARAGRVSRRQVLIALATTTRFGSSVLMGTSLSVLVGQVGSAFAVSSLFTTYFLGMMVFAPVWGAVADVTGRRRAVLVGTGVLATLTVLPLVVLDGVWAMVGLRGLYAVFAAGFPPVMLAVVSEMGGDAERGRAVGFFNSARAAGFTAGQLGAGLLLGLFVPDSLFLAIAAISVVATVAVAFVADAGDPQPTPSLPALVAEVRRRLLPAVDERAHLRRNGLSWLYVALALRNMSVMGVMSLMPVYLTDSLGTTELLMGVLMALNPASQMLFMTLFGRVADLIGRKPLIATGMAASGVFGVVAAAASLPGTLAGRVAVVSLAFLCIAAGFSAMITGALAFIGDVAPAGRESELLGLRTTAKGVGGVLGPPLVGVLATVTSYPLAFGAGSLLALVAAGLVATRLVETNLGTRTAPAAGD